MLINFNQLKTFYNALAQKMKSFRGNWNQNDPTADDYIKNRTHWEETIQGKFALVPEMTVNISDDGGYQDLSNSVKLTAGEKYTVILNGITYECVARDFNDEDAVIIGNGAVYGDGIKGNDEPFSCDNYSDGTIYLNVAAAGTYTISICSDETRTIVHKLDKKFIDIPDNLVTEEDVINLMDEELAPVAWTNDYDSLSGKPTIYTDVVRYSSQSLTDTQKTAARNNISAASSADVANKMDKINPTGTGAFSLNRKSGPPIGNYSFAEGYNTMAIGQYSHAEGNATSAAGLGAHAEGNATSAGGQYSHAEGDTTSASHYGAHAEGSNTKATAVNAHAEGDNTRASSANQHVQGEYNIEDKANKYLHIVGNGKTNSSRSNAHTLDRNGLGWFQGGLKIGGTNQDDINAKEIATQEYVENVIATHNTSEDSHSDLRALANDLATRIESLTGSKDHIVLSDTVTGIEYIIQMQNGNLVSSLKCIGIEVTNMPTKTEYTSGEKFDPTGMIVVATYPDGSTKEVTGYTYYSERLTEGMDAFEISYSEAGSIYTDIVQISVSPFDAATALIDFTYTDNGDGTYTITGWKQTLNGEPSTELIVPDNPAIIL